MSSTNRPRRALGASALSAVDVLSKAVGFGITPYLANAMGPVDFGAMTLYISIAQIVTFLISLGGAGLLTAEVIRHGEVAGRHMRFVNLRLSALITAVLLPASVAISYVWPSLLSPAIAVLIVAIAFLQAMNTLELAYFRGLQTYRWAIVGQVTFSLLNVALTVLAFNVATADAFFRLLCVAAASGVVQAIYAIRLHRKSDLPPDPAERQRYARMIANFGRSIFLHQASYWIRTTVDRFVVLAYFGAVANGTFGLAVTLASILAVMFASVSQALQPFMFARLKTLDLDGIRRLRACYMVGVLCAASSYLVLLWLTFDMFFEPSYRVALDYIPILLIGTAAQSVYLAYTYAPFYQRRGGAISTVTVSALVVHLICLGSLILLDAVTPVTAAWVFAFSSAWSAWWMRRLSRRSTSELVAAGHFGPDRE